MIINTEDFKTYITLNTNDFDDVIALLIKSAVKWAEAMTNNKIEEIEIEEYFDGDEINNEMFLTYNLNLQNLVIENERNGSWQEVSSDNYVFYDDEGVVKFNYVNMGEMNYRATYKTGFTSKNIPSDIKVAILKIVGRLWNKRKSDGISNENLGDAGVAWENYLSPEISALLSKYKKINV
ncbi:MAG: hypothetical protein K9M44_00205 [Candidatus Pacebacteria bacterium]|nr:hypothetical protein [Candidatus Paceibacterota bacterium]